MSGNVGKTSLLMRFMNAGSVLTEYEPTLEDEYETKRTVRDVDMTMTFVDTSGKEELMDMWEVYLQNADSFVLVFSLNSIKSFTAVKDLIPRILVAKDLPIVPLVIVANKSDLDLATWQVTHEQVQGLGELHKCPTVFCSAKDNTNVATAFTTMLEQWQRLNAPIRCGWLTKQGAGDALFKRKNWLKRWFQLSDLQLTYRKAQDTPELQGAIFIKHIKDIANDQDELAFRIVCVNRTYSIRADDIETKAVWMNQLRNVLAHL